MDVYEFILEPESSVATNSQTAYPIQSDTVMGQVLWQLYYAQGEKALLELKGNLKNGAKLAVSSAIPTGYLPVPKIPRGIRASNKLNCKELEQEKKLKKIGYLKIEHWQQLCNNLSTHSLTSTLKAGNSYSEQKPAWLDELVMKVAINRKTFQAQEGQLFTQREFFFNKGAYSTLSLFFASSIISVEEFAAYLKRALLSGYGKRASTGKGYVKIKDCQKANLPQASNPNAFMVLGNYYPSAQEKENHSFNGFYILNTKFGKLGDVKAKSRNPFKQPLLHFEPGSLFKAKPENVVVGTVIENVSSEPDVWQHLQTICLGVNLSE